LIFLDLYYLALHSAGGLRRPFLLRRRGTSRAGVEDGWKVLECVLPHH
jgi:hypothetical protein